MLLQGKNIVDACKSENVKHLVYSGLESVQDAIGKECAHFDSKGKVENYIQDQGSLLSFVSTSPLPPTPPPSVSSSSRSTHMYPRTLMARTHISLCARHRPAVATSGVVSILIGDPPPPPIVFSTKV